MGRAAKVQSFFESAMTDFTEQLLLNHSLEIHDVTQKRLAMVVMIVITALKIS